MTETCAHVLLSNTIESAAVDFDLHYLILFCCFLTQDDLILSSR